MAAISVRCPGCHERIAVPSEAVGGPFTCPQCQTVVGLADDGHPVIDGEVPDFSYLRKQAERDDDILVAEDQEDGESALESPTSRPAPRPSAKPAPSAPARVVYTPPPADAGNPFSGLSDRQRKTRPTPQSAPAPAPPPKARERHEVVPATVRTPAWVWPVLIALAVYAVAATGVAAWGWLRPAEPAPTTTKQVR